MTMTKSQAMKIAGLVMEIRPDWDFHGIMSNLYRTKQDASLADTAIAMLTAAATDAETPGALANPVYWPTWHQSGDEAKALKDKLRTEELKARRFREEADAARQRAAHPTRVAVIRAAAGFPRTPTLPTRPEGNQS